MQGNSTFINDGRPYLFGFSAAFEYLLILSLGILLLNGCYLAIALYIAGSKGPCYDQEELDEADAIVCLYSREAKTSFKYYTAPAYYTALHSAFQPVAWRSLGRLTAKWANQQKTFLLRARRLIVA